MKIEIIILSDITDPSNTTCSLLYLDSNFPLLFVQVTVSGGQKNYKGIHDREKEALINQFGRVMEYSICNLKGDYWMMKVIDEKIFGS